MASPNVQEPRAPFSPLGFVTEDERAAIRLQLDRLVEAPSFRNSKRFSELLRYLVARTLDGRGAELKERTIGVEVFGRAPDYDTGTDHVVRTAAGELRKRLAQYYLEPNHESEIRIDLLPGSYVPHFRRPNIVPPSPANGPVAVALVDPAMEEVVPPAAPQIARSSQLRVPAAVAIGAVALVATGLAIRSLTAPRSPFEQFWNPVLASQGTVSVSLGAATANEEAVTVREFGKLKRRQVNLGDATTLAALTGLLQAKGKRYRILGGSSTTFADLQGGPVVLIGALNNDWTMRLAGPLRFSVECNHSGDARIVDKQSPSRSDWATSFNAPYLDVTRDYAVISRVRDPKTEQVAVMLGGIADWGTMAAGEFVSNPAQLRKIVPFAPKDWENKNLQVVISTDVIRGSSGPPNVLAAYFW